MRVSFIPSSPMLDKVSLNFSHQNIIWINYVNTFLCAYLSFFLFSSPLTLFLALCLHLLLFFCTWYIILVPAITVVSEILSPKLSMTVSYHSGICLNVMYSSLALNQSHFTPQSLYSIDSQHLWKIWYYFIYL